MASEPTEYTAEAKSEPNAQVAGQATCPFDPKAAANGAAPSNVAERHAHMSNRDWWPNHLRLDLLLRCIQSVRWPLFLLGVRCFL